MADDAKAESLRFGRFAMMLAGQSHQTFGKADEPDAECTLIDHGLNGLIRTQRVATVPKARHHERKLLGKRRLLKLKAVAELTRRDVKHRVKFGKEPFDALLFILNHHALNGYAHNVDRRKREIAATDRSFFAIAVFKHTRAATHRSHLIFIAFGVGGIPFLMLIERSVKIDKIGEEATSSDLTGQAVKIIVAVGRQI